MMRCTVLLLCMLAMSNAFNAPALRGSIAARRAQNLLMSAEPTRAEFLASVAPAIAAVPLLSTTIAASPALAEAAPVSVQFEVSFVCTNV